MMASWLLAGYQYLWAVRNMYDTIEWMDVTGKK